MFNFDASSIIHAWDNYPPENPHFYSLWGWIATQVQDEKFSISKPALDEVNHKIPECGKWLEDNNIKTFPLTPSVLSATRQIKTLLNIAEEEYTKGVSENDLLIIAIAKETGTTLVSEESRQKNLQSLKKSNYKIPAVCSMPEVNVECIPFLKLLGP